MMTSNQSLIGSKIQVIIDRPIGSKHHTYDWFYELNYGYIPNTKAPDGEEIDAYVLGIKEPIKEITGQVVAIIKRENDDDDKLIVVPDGYPAPSDKEIIEQTHFQEKWFKIKIVR